MAYAPYFKSIQKVAYKYVDDSSNEEESHNEAYISNQSKVIESQNQNKLGTIPEYIDTYSHIDLIKNLNKKHYSAFDLTLIYLN